MVVLTPVLVGMLAGAYIVTHNWSTHGGFKSKVANYNNSYQHSDTKNFNIQPEPTRDKAWSNH